MPRPTLVTGAAGFVGSHLVRSLLSDRPDTPVVGWRRPASRRDPLLPPTSASLHWQDVDLLDSAAVAGALAETQPSEVFHCAGVANVADSWKNIVPTLEANVLGTQHVIDGLRRANVRARVLMPGSALVYRPKRGALTEDDAIGPVNPYGISKLAQEMQARRLRSDERPVVTTRSFTHIGPGQNLSYAASSFAYQIARIERRDAEPIIRVGRLDARRDLTDVRDTVAAYRALMARGTPGRVYNVCSGQTYQMRDIVAGLVELATVSIRIEVDPERVRPNDYPELRGDRSRITTEVGWEPQIHLDQTLGDILAYWRTAE